MRDSFHFDSECARFRKGGICFDGLLTGQIRDAFAPIKIFLNKNTLMEAPRYSAGLELYADLQSVLVYELDHFAERLLHQFILIRIYECPL